MYIRGHLTNQDQPEPRPFFHHFLLSDRLEGPLTSSSFAFCRGEEEMIAPLEGQERRGRASAREGSPQGPQGPQNRRQACPAFSQPLRREVRGCPWTSDFSGAWSPLSGQSKMEERPPSTAQRL